MPENPLSLDAVRAVARLARLELTKAQLASMSGELASILGYVGKIAEVEVAGVEPMAHVAGVTNVLRDDIVEPSLPVEQVLMNAPETDGPFFKVPKVIGGEDSAG